MIGGTKSQAQQRRQMENYEFEQLAKELPLARAISVQHIDKTAMVRLAFAYITLHHIYTPTITRNCFGEDSDWTSDHLELFDGFLIIMDSKGYIVYISETISIYLGLSQVETTGNHISDYIHPQDFNCFQSAVEYCEQNWPQMCNIRFKSTLTKRANKDMFRLSPGYKVVRLAISQFQNVRMISCSPIQTPVLSTITINNDSLIMTTTLDLTIIYADEQLQIN